MKVYIVYKCINNNINIKDFRLFRTLTNAIKYKNKMNKLSKKHKNLRYILAEKIYEV